MIDRCLKGRLSLDRLKQLAAWTCHAQHGAARKSCWAFAALILLPLLVLDNLASAVIVQRGDETIRGYLRQSDEQWVVIDEVLPGGATRRRRFRRSELRRFLNAVEPGRLAALDESDPKSYFNYADELSEKLADPDARRTALRLYLIAAYLDPDRLGRSSLQSMALLAESAVEERRYRSMAYLLDHSHDPDLLKPAKLTGLKSLPEENGQRRLLRAGLQALWSGRRREAARFASMDQFRQALAPFADSLSFDEYAAWANGSDDWLPPSILRKAVALELILSPARAATAAVDRDESSVSWGAADWRRPSRATGQLRLESITPFDPRKSRYRDGQWVTPSG